MLNKKSLITLAVSSLIVSVCAVANANDLSSSKNTDNNANLIFYRDNTGSANKAVNIAINGEYQSSLQQHGYTTAVVCAQPQKVGVALTGSDPTYMKKHKGGQYINPERGQVSYFKVSIDDKDNVILSSVERSIAEQEMKSNKYQSNTLPRVEYANTCKEPYYSLELYQVFPFNKSSLKSITVNGSQEIKEIAKDIQQHPKLNQVEVLVYANPKGSAKYNSQLSQKRADAVKALLVKSGVNPNIIEAKGVNADDLAIRECVKEHGEDEATLQQCNKFQHIEVKLHTLK